MPTISSRCVVCTHPQRTEIHIDKFTNHMTYEELTAKYFPQKVASFESSFRHTIGAHFKRHWNVKKEVETHLINTTRPNAIATISPAEVEIFTQEAREKINADLTMQSMAKTLMRRANDLADEWERVHKNTKCATCGRDDNGTNLAKILSVFRELREQMGEWTKMKNPVGMVSKLAEKTFLRFVEEMTTVYIAQMSEKARAVSDAANSFFSGEINQGLFVKRLAELSDFGTDKIAEEAETRFKIIMAAAFKEIKG